MINIKKISGTKPQPEPMLRKLSNILQMTLKNDFPIWVTGVIGQQLLTHWPLGEIVIISRL